MDYLSIYYVSIYNIYNLYNDYQRKGISVKNLILKSKQNKVTEFFSRMKHKS